MKKFLFTGLIIFIILIATAIFFLNLTGIISLQAWGENIILSTPFIRDYVSIDQDKQAILLEKEQLSIKIQQLEEKNSQLSRNLETLQQFLEAQESEINQLEVELTFLQDEEKQKRERIDNLIQIYSRIDPYDAAPIFAEMEMEMALLILSNLDFKKTASILSFVNPELAAEITYGLNEFDGEITPEMQQELEEILE